MTGVLVGVHGAEHASDALRFAVEEARIRNCGLTVVEVAELPKIAEEHVPEDAAALEASVRKRAERLLQVQVDDALDGRGVESLRVEVHAGDPVDVLMDLGHTADLLVVARASHGGLRHLLNGSVSTQLVNHAPCPVVVVPTRPRPTPASGS